MAVVDRVRDLCEPILDGLGLSLFDLDFQGGRLLVSVDREGGADMEVIAEATRQISRALDEADPVSGKFTLEVSSPGLERTLRTPDHHRWAVGKDVRIKTRPGVDGPRRVEGQLRAADDDGITVALAEPDESGATERTLAYDDIDRTRTTFEWGPSPKPGGKGVNRADRRGSGRGGKRPAESHDQEAKVEST